MQHQIHSSTADIMGCNANSESILASPIPSPPILPTPLLPHLPYSLTPLLPYSISTSPTPSPPLLPHLPTPSPPLLPHLPSPPHLPYSLRYKILNSFAIKIFLTAHEVIMPFDVMK